MTSRKTPFAIWLFILGSLAILLYKTNLAIFTQSADGKIAISRVDTHVCSYPSTNECYYPYIEVQYTVSDKTHGVYNVSELTSHSDANETVLAYPVGMNMLVWYNYWNPSQSAFGEDVSKMLLQNRLDTLFAWSLVVIIGFVYFRYGGNLPD